MVYCESDCFQFRFSTVYAVSAERDNKKVLNSFVPTFIMLLVHIFKCMKLCLHDAELYVCIVYVIIA